MKKKGRFWRKLLIITSIFIGCLALSVLLLWRNADRILTSYADQKLNEFIAHSDSFNLSYSDLDLNLAKGTVRLKDVSFSKDSISATVKTLEAGNINPREVWKTRQLMLDYISLNGVKLSALLGHKADTVKVKSLDSTHNQQPSGIQKFIDTIGVSKVMLKGGELSFHRLGNHMRLGIGDINLNLYDIGYGISSGHFGYCDSLYDLSLSKISFTSGTGLYAMSLDSLSTRNSGKIAISNFKGENTVGKLQLTNKKGKVPVSWTEFKIKKLHTSKVNIVRSVNERKIEIDSVVVNGNQLTVFRDARHAAKTATKMPQEALTSISIPLHIKNVDVRMPYLKLENQPQKGSTGSIQLHDVAFSLNNVSNQEGNTLKARIRPHLGKGSGDIHLHLVNDKNSSFTLEANLKNVKGSDLESLLNPLFGVSVSADISKLTSNVNGNRNSASGSFCLQYTDLQIHMNKQSQKKIDKSDLVNHFAGAAIHKQNPRKPGEPPYSCTVNVKRDPMKPVGNYLTSILFDGVKKTVLRDLTLKEVDKLISKGHKSKENLKEKIKEKTEKGKEKVSSAVEKITGKVH